MGLIGDYEKNGNDINVYKNTMGNGRFLFKHAANGYWMVCTNCPAYCNNLLQYCFMNIFLICNSCSKACVINDCCRLV